MSDVTDLQAADAALKAEVAQILADIEEALSGPNPDIEAVTADIRTQIAALQAGDPELPVVSGVSPNTGTIVGGDTVTVTGSRFTGATQVDLGATAAESFTVMSDSQITFVTPVTAAGTWDVTVETPAGTSAITTADEFTTS